MFTTRFLKTIGTRAVSTAAKRAEKKSIVGFACAAAGAAVAASAVYVMEERSPAQSDIAYAISADEMTIRYLEERMNELQVSLSGKTNSAFVFIKPHACKGNPGKVEALVEEKLKSAGIRITGQGDMDAATIDKNQHIDTHYGAIASKAVILKPSELNVPDKGKKQFKEMFGMEWDEAVSSGKVYNAKDAAAKLGVDGHGLEKKWRKLTRGKDLVKFGGGFYCGTYYVMRVFHYIHIPSRPSSARRDRDRAHSLSISLCNDQDSLRTEFLS